MVSFTVTSLVRRMQSFSSIAQDGEGGKGLKLERNGHIFQLRMQFNSKLPTILIWSCDVPF